MDFFFFWGYTVQTSQTFIAHCRTAFSQAIMCVSDMGSSGMANCSPPQTQNQSWGGEFMQREQNWAALVARSSEPCLPAVALKVIDTSSSPSNSDTIIWFLPFFLGFYQMFYLCYQYSDKLPTLLAAETIIALGFARKSWLPWALPETVFGFLQSTVGHKEVRDGYSCCMGSQTSVAQPHPRARCHGRAHTRLQVSLPWLQTPNAYLGLLLCRSRHEHCPDHPCCHLYPCKRSLKPP